jgi:hypothetical protein
MESHTDVNTVERGRRGHLYGMLTKLNRMRDETKVQDRQALQKVVSQSLAPFFTERRMISLMATSHHYYCI